jgi:hypothetical protein
MVHCYGLAVFARAYTAAVGEMISRVNKNVWEIGESYRCDMMTEKWMEHDKDG